MYRLVLGLQYDGSQFQGWQTQPNGLTVQDSLEKAIFLFTKTEIRTYCAGRTDTGVHAFEQVVHFDTDLKRDSSSWVRGINAFLPTSIAVIWSKQFSDIEANKLNDFHARFSAKSRTYHYLLHNAPIQSPLLYSKVGWHYKKLSIIKMRLAAQYIIGEHDFSVFRAASCQAKSPIKIFYELEITENNSLIVFKLKANAFLHHMVRNIIGALIYIGSGKKDPEWILELINSRNRKNAAPTFMADGLYLSKIQYDDHWELPQLETYVYPFI